MAWTRDKPTGEGWYWHMKGYTNAVSVERDSNYRLFVFFPGEGTATPMSETSPDAEWCGPIHPPE